MTTMGVTVFYNRVQLAGSDKDQLMLLRTLQDNESNIIGNRSQNVPTKNCVMGTSGTGVVTGVGSVNGPSGTSNVSQQNTIVLPPYDPSRLKKHGKNGQPPPVAVARRNARERNRVKQVNDGFAMLRQKIPNHVAAGYGDRGKKLSKVETLRMAVEYIRGLQRLLAEADGVEYETAQGTENALPTPSPTGSAFSGSTHNGSGEILSIEDEQPVKEEYTEYLLEEEEDEEEREKRSSKKYNNPLIVRLSPSVKTNSAILKRRKVTTDDYYSQSAGDEENVEPSDARCGFSRFSPCSLTSPPIKNEFRGGQNEEHLQTRVIMSPYGTTTETGSETTNPDEVPTAVVYASNLEPLSGTLYYKHEISEPGEFIDVVSWWEQEQGRIVHHTQPHAQRLTHV